MIRELVAHIQFLLESSSTARRRSDPYKFYFLSNIALHEIIRLKYVLDGNIEYNYNPPNSAVDSSLSSTMELSKSALHMKRLINFFLEQLDKTSKTDRFMAVTAHKFCQLLLQRDSILDQTESNE